MTSFSKSATEEDSLSDSIFKDAEPSSSLPKFPGKGNADKRRKRSHPPVILQKENHRTSTEALMQARMTPTLYGYMYT